MKAIKIQIVRFVMEHQPNIIEGRFTDAFGKEHIVHEKSPVISQFYLEADSEYPQPGEIACEIVNTWNDEKGRKIITVSSEKPWHIETLEGDYPIRRDGRSANRYLIPFPNERELKSLSSHS